MLEKHIIENHIPAFFHLASHGMHNALISLRYGEIIKLLAKYEVEFEGRCNEYQNQ